MNDLGDLTWSGVPDEALVIVPVGSTEQHGPHLPLRTDTLVAEAVARELAAATGALLAPALPYGAAGEHEAFPGTVSLGTQALTTVLVEHGRSACRWAQRLLLLSGHGGNHDALVSAGSLLRHEGRDVAWAPAQPLGVDSHAGRTETSLLLALAPELVDLDRAGPGRTEDLTELLPAIRAGSVRDVSANGVLGDPAGASREEGRALLERQVVALTAAVVAWRVDAQGRLGS